MAAMTSDVTDLTDVLLTEVRRRLPDTVHRPFVFGLCGAQGSGKSTLAERLVTLLRNAGLNADTLSIDDLYLSHAARQRLAREVHPLLATRGVPGTHDPRLGLRMIERLGEPDPVRIPRFDKSSDDPASWDTWPIASGLDVLVFEGWCVGAVPQDTQALQTPVNALERGEDPDGRWRRWVNERLALDYQSLFDRIDMLGLLAAPGFDVVAGWRREQEAQLAASVALAEAHKLLQPADIDRFVAHYQRLTEHILQEMPRRADVVARIDGARRTVGITVR